MEEPVISGVVQDASESKITILGVPDRPGVSADIFEALAQANVNVDPVVGQHAKHLGCHAWARFHARTYE